VDLHQFVAAMRMRWLFIVLTFVAGTLAAAVITLNLPPEYSSTGRIFISTPTTTTSSDAFSTVLVSQRAASYADLATDPALLQKVLDRTGLPETRDDLAKRISANVVLGTQIVQVTATGGSPETAQSLADAEVKELISMIGDLERPSGEGVQAAVIARSTGAPSFNSSPTGPNLMLNLAVAVVLSLLLGIAGAMLRERLDATIKSRDDAEKLTGAPVLAALPLDPSVARSARSEVEQGSALVEAFRVLRTNLRFTNIDAQRQMLLITSAVPGEGKTLTAVNLARSMTLAGQSVLLIDCDFRNPNVARNLGLETGVGVLSVLIGRIPLEEAIQADSSGLHVLASGPKPPNPAEILETDAMRDLLAAARTAYDVIILDAPPMLPVADTSALIGYTDGVILMARFGSTKKDVLQLAAERIVSLGGRLYGNVLNGTPRRAAGVYGYGYGYGYGDLPELGELTKAKSPGGARRREGVDERVG